MWGQRRKVKGRDTAGAVKIMEIQRCPSPDVIKTMNQEPII